MNCEHCGKELYSVLEENLPAEYLTYYHTDGKYYHCKKEDILPVTLPPKCHICKVLKPPHNPECSAAGIPQYSPRPNKINKILRKISEETSFLSFLVSDHPKIQEIVDIGNEAIPILLDHLRKSVLAEKAHYRGPYDFQDYAPTYACAALRGITNYNPVKPEHRGNLFKSIQDWLDWDAAGRQ